MKKLMIAAVAIAAGVAFADEIKSANIVGYAPTSNGAHQKPIIGGQFFAVDGATTFDLVKLSVPGTKTWTEVDPEDEPGYYEWVCDYMVPKNEYIRALNPENLAAAGNYTYVSAEYLLDNLGDVCEEDWESTIETYKWAIGWWKYDSTYDYKKNIKNHTEGDMMVSTKTFPNGTGFIANFVKGATRSLQSNGEVKTTTFGFSNNAAQKPLFVNQLPVAIDLTDMTIPGTKTWTEVDPEDEPGYYEWVCDYMVPKNEYIRALNPENLAAAGNYTYVSAEYLLDNLGDVCEEDWESTIEEYKWAIGWWKYDNTYDYKKNIKNHTEGDMMVTKGAVPVSAGYGFIGNFVKGATRQVNFPSATDVPSKK